MDKRTQTTLLHLLRYHADQQRRMSGPKLCESYRGTGIELTPNEMEQLADDMEAGHVDLTRAAV